VSYLTMAAALLLSGLITLAVSAPARERMASSEAVVHRS
jgi:hypothetical protein